MLPILVYELHLLRVPPLVCLRSFLSPRQENAHDGVTYSLVRLAKWQQSIACYIRLDALPHELDIISTGSVSINVLVPHSQFDLRRISR